ncbi:hypothetical protein J6590_052145 [Homalodisca vitripennis]|nr:hypothetical protein J6590_052145 [Homalodisca vitripennis]
MFFFFRQKCGKAPSEPALMTRGIYDRGLYIDNGRQVEALAQPTINLPEQDTADRYLTTIVSIAAPSHAAGFHRHRIVTSAS